MNLLLRAAATTGSYQFNGVTYSSEMPDHVAICSQESLLRYNFRWHSGDLMNIVHAYIRGLKIPALSDEFKMDIDRKKRAGDHTTDSIFQNNYRAEKNNLYAFTTLGNEYERYWSDRLSNHPRISPIQFMEKNKVIEPIGMKTVNNVLSIKNSLHDVRNLTFHEQQLDWRFKMAFREAYYLIEKYKSKTSKFFPFIY